MDETKSNLIESSSDIIEYGLDFFIENEAVKDFPVLGTAIKIGFTIKSISDKIFLKKVERFLFRFNELNAKEKYDMIVNIKLEEKTRKKVGESLILLIDRFSDFDKPEILSHCFLAYLRGQLTLENFLRLGNAIDFSYSPDLREFISNPDSETVHIALVRSGLTEITRQGMAINTGAAAPFNLKINITELGNQFLNVFNKENK